MIFMHFISAILAVAIAAEEIPTPRGITGSVTIIHSGEPLQAKLDQGITSPMLVRDGSGCSSRFEVEDAKILQYSLDPKKPTISFLRTRGLVVKSCSVQCGRSRLF